MIEIEVNFRNPQSLARSAREGWGPAEGFGAWMIGSSSRIVLPAPPRQDGEFELGMLIGPYLGAGKVDSQRMRIIVNGHTVFETAMTRILDIRCPVPAQAIAARPYIDILFEHPDAVSPSAIGAGDDLRELAASAWVLTLMSTSPLPEAREPAFGRATFMARPLGNLGNRMIQHMVALAVMARAPGSVQRGMELDEWGIRTAPDDGTWADLALVDEQRIDVDAVGQLLRSGSVHKIVYRGYGQRIENLLPRESYRDVFVTDEPDIVAFDSRHLVINVRSGDVVAGTVSIYVLIPINFYRDLIAQTGLKPVFMGQIEPNPYTDALRAAFPNAIYHESQGAIRDFETIRRSKNIVVAVSTFSWLAAWLSDAEQIFLPVNALLNPLQFPAVDLIPKSDLRYRFYLFPNNTASPDFASAHAAIDGQWREIASDELSELIRQNNVPLAVENNTSSRISTSTGDFSFMFEDVRQVLVEAETAASRGYAMDVLYHLRRLPLPDYAQLIWSLPRQDLPEISKVLPHMAPEEAQLGWNGKSGIELQNQSVDFCRILSSRFQKITGRSMENIRAMDFGCGWGRLTRMLYWYSDPQNCCAVDAMGQAIQRCRDDRLLGELVQSDYIAEELKVGERRFDLIVAYSVFTHTPLRVTRVLLSTLRRKIRSNGLLVLTVRPVEFWSQFGADGARSGAELATDHRENGFSFLPIGVTAPNGEDIYGETSMTPEWIAANCPEWEVEGIDRGLDTMQTIVFLTPRW